MKDDEIPFAAVRRSGLSGSSESVPSSTDRTTDPLTRFKGEQLRCIASDEPWDTSLTWSDAQTDLADIDAADRDPFVAEALQMHDEGLVYFFEVSDFGESYSRTPREEEKLTRERLADVLRAGSRAEQGGVVAPLLGVRATQKGRDVALRLANDVDRARDPED